MGLGFRGLGFRVCIVVETCLQCSDMHSSGPSCRASDSFMAALETLQP